MDRGGGGGKMGTWPPPPPPPPTNRFDPIISIDLGAFGGGGEEVMNFFFCLSASFAKRDNFFGDDLYFSFFFACQLNMKVPPPPPQPKILGSTPAEVEQYLALIKILISSLVSIETWEKACIFLNRTGNKLYPPPPQKKKAQKNKQKTYIHNFVHRECTHY